MKRITDANADLSTGSYAVFENIDGSSCVAYRSSDPIVRIYHNSESGYKVINDTEYFRKYRFYWKVSSIIGYLPIHSIMIYLNSTLNRGWNIVNWDSQSKTETDVKQKTLNLWI